MEIINWVEDKKEQVYHLIKEDKSRAGFVAHMEEGDARWLGAVIKPYDGLTTYIGCWLRLDTAKKAVKEKAKTIERVRIRRSRMGEERGMCD